jgi:hypothetical protein
MLTLSLSARRIAPNQTLTFSASATLPMTLAFGAM